MNRDQLKNVIDCAVSNSINYKTKSLVCDENLIQTAIFSYANNVYANQVEVSDVYVDSLASVKNRKSAIGRVPMWVPLIFILGFALLAMEIITLISFGFNIVFVFFLVLAFSLVGTGTSYLRSTSGLRKAIKQWKKGISEANTERMISALKGIAKTVG